MASGSSKSLLPDVIKKEQLSKQEIERRKKALIGSKVGLTLTMLHGGLMKRRDMVRAGRYPMGISAEELERLLTEVIIVLLNVRDFYVDEKQPKPVVVAPIAKKPATPPPVVTEAK